MNPLEAANDNNLIPEWCSAKTMARLLDVGVSTFRAYVKKGQLPKGHRFEGVVRWPREHTLAAFEGRTLRTDMIMPTKAANDNVDPIIAGIIAHGTQARARRRSA
jgi:hypothetical protein